VEVKRVWISAQERGSDGFPAEKGGGKVVIRKDANDLGEKG